MQETVKVGNLYIQLCMGVTMGHVSERLGGETFLVLPWSQAMVRRWIFKRRGWDAELTFSFALYGARPGHLRGNMK